MIPTEIDAIARRILHDVEAGTDNVLYRWSNSILGEYMNMGLQEIYSLRPEFWLSPTGDLSAIGLVTVTTRVYSIIDLIIPNRLTDAMVSFVVYKALSEDDADTENINRAQLYRAQFQEAIR